MEKKITRTKTNKIDKIQALYDANKIKHKYNIRDRKTLQREISSTVRHRELYQENKLIMYKIAESFGIYPDYHIIKFGETYGYSNKEIKEIKDRFYDMTGIRTKEELEIFIKAGIDSCAICDEIYDKIIAYYKKENELRELEKYVKMGLCELALWR